jgi:hypothetical protein
MDKKIEDYIKEVDRRADKSFLLAHHFFAFFGVVA